MTAACFHCGEPLRGSTLTVRIGQRDEAVCCQGCLAVANLITGAGLDDFYRFRETSSARPSAADGQDAWSAYGLPEVAAQFTRTSADADSVTLLIEGLRCSACSWLIEQALCRTDGVKHASTNAATARAHIEWDRSRMNLADVMRAIAQLGYRPHPLNDATLIQAQQQEHRRALKRLAVAGFGMMQVMMFAVAVYSAQLAGEIMDADILDFFRIVSLLVATPVMFYAGAPVLAGAWNSLRLRTIGMDVPVGIALVLAYTASVWNTFLGSGEVYFDSVTMFLFFLTLGRFVQMSVRHRTTDVTDALARQLPAFAHRLLKDEIQDIPISALRRGDVVLVRKGEILPVDGELLDAEAVLDEAMLTGEPIPVRRQLGEHVAAGTLNVHNPIRVSATGIAAGTLLSHIVSLMQRAQAQKPAMSRAADAAAARFLRYVLLSAGLTCALWLSLDPSRAFAATLAVLVVACPCAFAIATPAALSAATAQLARHGVLVTNPDALEALAHVDRFVLDKTGTLTRGEVRISRCVALTNLNETRCLQIAAAIELASEHPLARAFAQTGPIELAQAVRTVAGCGVEAVVDGRRYRIGTAHFVAELRGTAATATSLAELRGTTVVLGDEQRELALFELHDELRGNASAAVAALRRLHIVPQILSGDGHAAVSEVAGHCCINEYFSRRSPTQKLAHVQALREEGRRVAMIGDGVNDAPVLAAANVSIAMGRGAALAQVSADMVLVNENLESIAAAVAVAHRTLRIARQNRLWSALYNFGSLPLAALGFIPPWLAALGMSLSSVAVVLNAMRLLPVRAAGHWALRSDQKENPCPDEIRLASVSGQSPEPSAQCPSLP